MSRHTRFARADNRSKAKTFLTALLTLVLVADMVQAGCDKEGDTREDERPMCTPGKVGTGALVVRGACSAAEGGCPPGTDRVDVAAGTHDNPALGAGNLAPRSTRVAVHYVTVGNPGNPDDTHGSSTGNTYGGVSYVYRIGKYEVTAAQHCAFLDAVAANDPYELYDPAMMQVVDVGYAGCQIQRHGGPGDYVYSVSADWADRPVNCVDFWSACRFANWLHNGQPAGPQDVNSTEDGAYTLSGYTGSDGRHITRNPGARVWIPSADEWYKAAYHKNDGVTDHYWDYPTGSDRQPGNRLTEPDPGNNANFAVTYRGQRQYTLGPPYWRTPVGEFENSKSPYGTCDQAGNAREWTDDLMNPQGGERIQHGASYATTIEDRADRVGMHAWSPWVGNVIVGFRVAAAGLKGDLAGRQGKPDGVVDCLDLAVLARAWAAYPADERWNPDCDLSQDARIDMLDLRLLAGNWRAGHEP